MRLDSSPLAPRPCLLRQGTRVFQASQPALFWVSAPGSPGFSGHSKSHHAFLPHTEADVSRKSPSVSGLEAQLSVFLMFPMFNWNNSWQMNYSFSDFGRHSVDLSLKTNQVHLTLQEDDWQYLLLRRKFGFLSMSLTASQYLKTFWWDWWCY